MRYLSICSGIEAASVAFEPLGWRPLAFSEIEAFPRAVLKHHYPDTPCHGDFTTLKDEPWIVDADMLCGGTPCQAFSVAGNRQSLADDRGNLTLQFVLLADAIDHLRSTAGRDPAWILWENVPGVLSTNDNAFGAFLGGLVGRTAPIPEPADGWTGAGVVDGPTRCAAWRILDAQHFGLAQRRKRVFVLALGGAGRWAVADALLPIIEGSRWHPAPSRPTREGVAPTLSSRPSGGGGLGTDFELDGGLIPETTGCITANYGEQAGQDMGADGMLIPSAPDIAHTLRGEGFDASEDGTGRGVPLVMSHGQANAEVVSDGSPSLTCNHEAPIVFDHTQSDRFWKKVEKTDECWLWRGAVKDTGYGVFWFNGRIERAHRVSWELHHGPVPEGVCVLHKCDIRICVNPDHLWLGDYADNNEDMADKGRAIIPVSYGEKHGKAKLTDDQVSEIKASSDSGVELANRYGVSRSTISSVRLGYTRNNGTSAMCVRMREGKEGGGKGPLVSEDQSLTLATANDQVLAYTIHGTDKTARVASETDLAGCIRTKAPGSIENSSTTVVASLAMRTREGVVSAELGEPGIANALRGSDGGRAGEGAGAVLNGMQVRRLTPVECCRLQGFPDQYLDITFRGKPAADGNKYKALGNSWAVPVVRYIAERIKAVSKQ